MLDFRNFCDEACKKGERHVDNPSLTNLLKFITVQFSAKVDIYFFDIHKSILLRYFSVTRKVLELIVSLGNLNSLSIDGKEKLKAMADGFANSGSFLVRVIIEKVIDIVDIKTIHEGVDIGEIKLIIGTLEHAEAYL